VIQIVLIDPLVPRGELKGASELALWSAKSAEKSSTPVPTL
jgi:hypothetical protein